MTLSFWHQQRFLTTTSRGVALKRLAFKHRLHPDVPGCISSDDRPRNIRKPVLVIYAIAAWPSNQLSLLIYAPPSPRH